MSDEKPFYAPDRGPQPPRQPKPGEKLFEFIRASDRAPMSCELRFHGESYGWEVQFFERGEFFGGSGAFLTKALAIQFAEQERKAFERGSEIRRPERNHTIWARGDAVVLASDCVVVRSGCGLPLALVTRRPAEAHDSRECHGRRSLVERTVFVQPGDTSHSGRRLAGNCRTNHPPRRPRSLRGKHVRSREAVWRDPTCCFQLEEPIGIKPLRIASLPLSEPGKHRVPGEVAGPFVPEQIAP
jgi:hypothetical protein